MSKPDLFDAFPQVSSKAWKQKIQFDLKGLDYNESLVWESPEGIKVKPFYHSEDTRGNAVPPFPRKGKWNIGQHIFVADAIEANKKALDILQRGAESLWFTVPSQEVQIDLLLKGIDASTTKIHLDFPFLSLEYFEQLNAITDKLPSPVNVHLDPVGHLARTGNWCHSMEKDFEMLGGLLSAHFQSHSLSIDVSLYQNAGATMVQQLAYAMAHANEYLHRSDLISDQPYIFKVSVGSNYFFEIAKLRALRWLWNTLASEYGIASQCHIIAFPSKRNKTLYDYNMNMLRTTMECMGAIIGGADTICNLPYDAMYHKANEFGERIARNQLLILKHESYFDKVSNAADGAYYIEALTQQMAEKALALFKTLEKGGGFLKQLKAHTLQKKIKENAQKEQERFNIQEEVLVGTNKYPNVQDKMKQDLELDPFLKRAVRKTLLEPILEKRLAEAMEQKRIQDE